MYNRFMNYTFEELIDKNTTYNKITANKTIKKFTQDYNPSLPISIDFDVLNLNAKLYLNNKKETIQLQKDNCKKIISTYKNLIKIIRFVKRKNPAFNNVFFVPNLHEKKNNNDIMLKGMLDIKFNTRIFNKLNTSILVACDFLDKENAMYNMCDFKDNKCAKHRAKNFTRSTGCCPSSCKFMDNCPCKTKNLSCKLIMCDYLVNQGYYFTPHTLAVLKTNMLYLERVSALGMFFKSTKSTFRFIWIVRFLIGLGIITIGLLGYSLLSPLFV